MELKYWRNKHRPKSIGVLIVPLWNWNWGSRAILQGDWCSNRTFMEPKYDKEVQSEETSLVLIVPLWNWNLSKSVIGWMLPRSNRTFMELKLYASRASQLKLVGSNRTFMELKLFSSMRREGASPVLIVPLWNWNANRRWWAARGAWVLIVPLWNWNILAVVLLSKLKCSNRTFMELKSHFFELET